MKNNNHITVAEQYVNHQKTNLQVPEYDFEKLGQELHDGVNPLLSAALLYLHMIKTTSKRCKELKETARSILLETVGYIRHLSADLVLPETSEKNLELLVEKHVARINKVGLLQIKIDFEKTGMLSSLTEVEIIHLYRIIQEQINNIIKYSKAKNVSIEFKTDIDGMYLKITDDGIGFDINEKKNGIGLYNMKKRIDELHGMLNIKSSPGNGCAIYISLPPHTEII